MRGGSSKGLYFRREDLPADEALRDRVLVAAMGSPTRGRSTARAGRIRSRARSPIVSRSETKDADVDYLFVQVVVGEGRVDTTPNCGNMLAGVGPFAIEQGIVPARDGETAVRVRMLNSDNLCELLVQTPGKRVRYDGDAHIDGVPGTAAPIVCSYLDVAGSATGSLLPTGRALDVVDGIEVTCIDNGMPVVVVRARDLGMHRLRAAAGTRAEQGAQDADRVDPFGRRPEDESRRRDEEGRAEDELDRAPRAGGHVCTRTFIPHDCHAAIGVLGAVSVATACILPGSAAQGIASVPEGRVKRMSVEHPTGEFSVTLEVRRHTRAAERAQGRTAADRAPDHARRSIGSGRLFGTARVERTAPRGRRAR